MAWELLDVIKDWRAGPFALSFKDNEPADTEYFWVRIELSANCPFTFEKF